MIPQSARTQTRVALCRSIHAALRDAMAQAAFTESDLAIGLNVDPGVIFRWLRRLDEGTLRNLDPVSDLVAALGCDVRITAVVQAERVAA